MRADGSNNEPEIEVTFGAYVPEFCVAWGWDRSTPERVTVQDCYLMRPVFDDEEAPKGRICWFILSRDPVRTITRLVEASMLEAKRFLYDFGSSEALLEHWGEHGRFPGIMTDRWKSAAYAAHLMAHLGHVERAVVVLDEAIEDARHEFPAVVEWLAERRAAVLK